MEARPLGKGMGPSSRTILEASVPPAPSVPWGSTSEQGNKVAWVAWFNDIPCEVLPVQSGNRLCLVYSLVAHHTSLDAKCGKLSTPISMLKATSSFGELPVTEIAAIMQDAIGSKPEGTRKAHERLPRKDCDETCLDWEMWMNLENKCPIAILDLDCSFSPS